MQWYETNGERMRIGLEPDDSMLAMPVRIEVSLTGAPWVFRARLLEAEADYCLLTLVDPYAPALRRGAAAVLHIGTPGMGERSIAGTIADVSPRPTGLTIRCAINRAANAAGLAPALTYPRRSA